MSKLIVSFQYIQTCSLILKLTHEHDDEEINEYWVKWEIVGIILFDYMIYI